MSFFPADWDHGKCDGCGKTKDHVIRRIDIKKPMACDQCLPFLCDDCHEITREIESKV